MGRQGASAPLAKHPTGDAFAKKSCLLRQLRVLAASKALVVDTERSNLEPARFHLQLQGGRIRVPCSTRRRPMFKRIMITAAAASVAVAAPAMAQNLGSGLVNVQVGDVTLLNGFLNNDQIAALNNLSVPVNVQVPVGVAANVCGVNANVLAKQLKGGDATCTAKSGSKALAQSVNKQLLSQKK
jgi:hypothetical protein